MNINLVLAFFFFFANNDYMKSIRSTRLSTTRVVTRREKRFPRNDRSGVASSKHVHDMHVDTAEIGP